MFLRVGGRDCSVGGRRAAGGRARRRQRARKRRFRWFSSEKAQDKDLPSSSSLGEPLPRSSEHFAVDDGRGEMRGDGDDLWECDGTRGEVISPGRDGVALDSHLHGRVACCRAPTMRGSQARDTVVGALAPFPFSSHPPVLFLVSPRFRASADHHHSK